MLQLLLIDELERTSMSMQFQSAPLFDLFNSLAE